MAATILGGGLITMAVGGLANMLTYLGDDLETSVPSVSYNEFEKKARTGDLVFTSGPTSVHRMITKSTWSHSGIIWRDPKTDFIYEWSSHMKWEGVMNTIGQVHEGSQLVPLDYLASDAGGVFWRQVSLDRDQRARLNVFVEKSKYKVKFSDLPELLAYLGPVMARIFNGFGNGMACSHLVAATYMAVDALANDRNLSQFSPETLSPSGDASWLVPVSPNVKMVVGYDTSRLISLFPKPRAITTDDERSTVPDGQRGRRGMQTVGKNKNRARHVTFSSHIVTPAEQVPYTLPEGLGGRHTKQIRGGSDTARGAKQKGRACGHGHHRSDVQTSQPDRETMVDSDLLDDLSL
ncbi:MAG: hypothetical protein P4L69_13475 [Desulfosporosinus sp.]|nr:hypothetical protein [Desulfosporosinus sp.]